MERIVNKALAKKPEDRYQRVEELLADLKELETAGKTSRREVADRAEGKKWLKRMAVPAGIGLLLILGFLLFRPLLFEQVLVSAPMPIAVISFENLTGDTTYNYLQKAIPNLLITSLEQSPYLQVATWERLRDLLKQTGQEYTEIINKDLGYELCRMEGINTIVVGSFTKAGNAFTTEVRILDVSSKRLLKGATANGRGEESIILKQVDELSREISKGVGLTERRIEITQRQIAEVTTTSMEAYEYFMIGKDYREKYYQDEVRRFMERAVQLDSTFATAYLYLARANVRHNQTAVIDAFKKAKHFAHKANIKERLYIEASYSIYIENDLLKGIDFFEQIAKQFPNEKEAHFSLGYFYQTIDLHKAKEELIKAVELDPAYKRAQNQLGCTYAWLGEFEKAIESIKKYESLSLGEPNPFDTMGDIYFMMGKLDEAIDSYKKALEMRPAWQAEFQISYLYALKEEYSEAMAWCDQLIAKHPAKSLEKADGYLWKGVLHYRLGNLDRALIELNRSIDLAKTVGVEDRKFTVESYRGWIYYDRGKLELSRNLFKKRFDNLAKKYPQNIPVSASIYNWQLGFIDLKTGRIDSAKSRLDRMKSFGEEMDQDNKKWNTYRYDILKTEVMLAQSSFDEVIAMSEKASIFKFPTIRKTAVPGLELWVAMMNYNFPESFLTDVFARAYQQKGDIDNAIAEYERLTMIDPKSNDRRLIPARFHYRLAKLYEQKGLTTKAMVRYEHFLTVWKNADPAWPELKDAKARLARLKM